MTWELLNRRERKVLRGVAACQGICTPQRLSHEVGLSWQACSKTAVALERGMLVRACRLPRQTSYKVTPLGEQVLEDLRTEELADAVAEVLAVWAGGDPQRWADLDRALPYTWALGPPDALAAASLAAEAVAAQAAAARGLAPLGAAWYRLPVSHVCPPCPSCSERPRLAGATAVMRHRRGCPGWESPCPECGTVGGHSAFCRWHCPDGSGG